MVGLRSQDAREDAMEGAHIEVCRQVASNEAVDTFPHLLGSLIGKGKSHDAPWLHTLLQKISDLIGKHTRLTRTRTSNHQRRSINIFHSLALRFIQVVQ